MYVGMTRINYRFILDPGKTPIFYHFFNFGYMGIRCPVYPIFMRRVFFTKNG